MERKATIVWDFDGVLAEAGKWEGHKKIGGPRTKWLNVIKRLHKRGVMHHISTCRLNPAPFGNGDDRDVVSGLANKCVRSWLLEQEMMNVFSEITGWKIYGDLYVDDRMPGFLTLDEMDEDTLYNYLEGILVCSGLLIEE